MPQCPGTAFENGKKGTAGIKKQVVLTDHDIEPIVQKNFNLQISLNDEIFFAERRQEAEAIRDKVEQRFN